MHACKSGAIDHKHAARNMQSASLFSEPGKGQLELSRLPSDASGVPIDTFQAATAVSPITALPAVVAGNTAGQLSNRFNRAQSSISRAIEKISTSRRVRGDAGNGEDPEMHELEKFDNWMIMKGATDAHPSVPWNLRAFFTCFRDHVLFPFNIPFFWYFGGENGRHHVNNSQWLPAWSEWVPSFKYSVFNLFLPITPFVIFIRVAMALILIFQFIDPQISGRRIDIRFELAFSFCCLFCWILTVAAKHATTPPILYGLWRTISLPSIVVRDEQLIASWLMPDMFRLLREMRLCASRTGREGLLQAAMLLPSCHPLSLYASHNLFILPHALYSQSPLLSFVSHTVLCRYVQECSKLSTSPLTDQPIEVVKVFGFRSGSDMASDLKSHKMTSNDVHSAFWTSLPDAECPCPGDCFAIAAEQTSQGTGDFDGYGSKLHFHRDSSKFVAFMQTENAPTDAPDSLPGMTSEQNIARVALADPSLLIPGYTRVSAITVSTAFAGMRCIHACCLGHDVLHHALPKNRQQRCRIHFQIQSERYLASILFSFSSLFYHCHASLRLSTSC